MRSRFIPKKKTKEEIDLEHQREEIKHNIEEINKCIEKKEKGYILRK